ncbi:hypothetical protein VTL71DRAFT_1903, partial [Oculimacula yallundae]
MTSPPSPYLVSVPVPKRMTAHILIYSSFRVCVSCVGSSLLASGLLRRGDINTKRSMSALPILGMLGIDIRYVNDRFIMELFAEGAGKYPEEKEKVRSVASASSI